MTMMKTMIAALALTVSAPAMAQEAPPALDVEHFDAMVMSHLEVTLRDPFSAVLRQTTAPRFVEGEIKRGLLGKKPYRGWMACYNLNAKNAYGAYTGFKRVAYLVDGGTITPFEGSESAAVTWDEQVMRRHCT
jgi:hypothetical protein